MDVWRRKNWRIYKVFMQKGIKRLRKNFDKLIQLSSSFGVKVFLPYGSSYETHIHFVKVLPIFCAIWLMAISVLINISIECGVC